MTEAGWLSRRPKILVLVKHQPIGVCRERHVVRIRLLAGRWAASRLHMQWRAPFLASNGGLEGGQPLVKIASASQADRLSVTATTVLNCGAD